MLSLLGHWKVVEYLLSASANADAMDLHFGTALHVATFKNNIKCAQVLLNGGKYTSVMLEQNTL